MNIPLKDRTEAIKLVRYNAATPPRAPGGLNFTNSNSLSLLDLWDILQRRWILAVCLFIVILASGFIALSRMQKPMYKAEATIFVPPDGKDVSNETDQANYSTIINQQILIILHYQTLSEAIHRLHDQGLNWQTGRESEQQAVSRLQSSIDVEHIPNSYEISIAAITRNPKESSLIANTIAQTFLDELSQPGTAGHVDRLTRLALEKATLTKELNDLLTQNAAISGSLQSIDPATAKALPGDQGLLELRKAAAVAHMKRIEAEVKLSQAQLTSALDAQRIVNEDPSTRAVMARLIQRKIELLQATKDMLPSHPVRKAAEKELASIETQLSEGPNHEIPKLASNLTETLRSDLEQATQIEDRINHDIARTTAKIPTYAETLGRAEAIRADIGRIQDRLTRIQSETDSIGVQAASGDSVRIFSFAVPPNQPIRARVTESMFAVVAVALLVAILIPLVLHKTDPRIYDPSTVEAVLGFPALGIRLKSSDKTTLFAGEHLRKLVAAIEQQIRAGCRTILLAGLKEPVPSALITDIWRMLTKLGVNVTVTDGSAKFSKDGQSLAGLICDANSNAVQMGGPNALIIDAPALLFSAEAQRLSSEASATLLVVQAGKNTKEDILRAARTLERIKAPAVGVILDNVRVERAGRLLRSDLKQYLPIQGHLAHFARKAGAGVN